MTAFESLCVFCGSELGDRPGYTIAAREVGVTLAVRGIELVYGGGDIGLMGQVADAAMAAGGRVIGVIPEYGPTASSHFQVVGARSRNFSRSPPGPN